jgi:hypothetical protein
LSAVCAGCDLKDYVPSQYVVALVDSVLLVEAGFPFVADDFALDFWRDMGSTRMVLKRKTNPF